MWNFLYLSGCRKFQCFMNISCYILGKTIEYNFLISQNLTYQEPFLYSLEFEISKAFPGHLNFKINIFIIILLCMQACKTLLFSDTVHDQMKRKFTVTKKITDEYNEHKVYGGKVHLGQKFENT